METLDRGLVAIPTEDGVLVRWRLLGTDPTNLGFHVYRDGERVNDKPITNSTNFLDPEGTIDSTYAVRSLATGELEESVRAEIATANQACRNPSRCGTISTKRSP